MRNVVPSAADSVAGESAAWGDTIGGEVQDEMTVVDDPRMTDAFSSRSLAERLANLYRSLPGYNLLSNRTEDELLALLPGGPGTIAQLDDDAVSRLWASVIEILQRRELEPVLRVHGVPYPLYPVGGDPAPGVPQVRLWDTEYLPEDHSGTWSLLGLDVGFPIGIPSCELTINADWIEYYARKGFNILTYRTVRNEAKDGSPYEWVFVSGIDEPWLSTDEAPSTVRRADGRLPPDVRAISTATSFVAPSPSRDDWVADVKEARRRLDALGGRHLFIVSVTDSVPFELKTTETLAADFAKVAKQAAEAGAHAVECYLARAGSRLESARVPCERDVATSVAILRQVRQSLGRNTRVLVKLSADLSDEDLIAIVVPLARDRVIDGVSGISPVEIDSVTGGEDDAHQWSDRDRRPAVAGYALRRLCQNFVKRLADIRREHHVDFDIIAMGGVMSPEDVVTLMGMGASAVQSATAAALDPDLARAAHLAYRSSVATKEAWNGFVVSVDADKSEFTARMTLEGTVNGMETRFGFDEVHPDQLPDVVAGAYLRWTNGWVAEGRQLLRQSGLRILSPPPPDHNEELAARALAQRVARVFDPQPPS